MNTLQERLRANPLPLPGVMELCREAADRIDVLESERQVQDAALAVARADFRELALRAEKLEAENAALLAVLKKARNEVAYMASGMTHAAWKTEQAQQVLTAIDAAIARSKT